VPAPAPLQAAARVRWDRLGRIAMLFVLLAVLFLYLSTGLHMLSTWRQSRHTNARVAAMQAEHNRQPRTVGARPRHAAPRGADLHHRRAARQLRAGGHVKIARARC
jgi:hypothetical protein